MRVLLVEDEKELSNALKEVLKRHNYYVDAVFDGAEALDYLLYDSYDCIILDLMMPKIAGIEVLKTIREKGIQTPVLILTAKAEINDRVLGLDTGADDYLTKPFAMKELLARVRSLLRRKEPLLGTKYTFGDIELDTLTFELSCNFKSEKLANKEYQLLELLMMSPKYPLSTSSLMERIWGYESETEINVVWVYISNLRRKLKKINSTVSIVASRNQGYYLSNEID